MSAPATLTGGAWLRKRRRLSGQQHMLPQSSYPDGAQVAMKGRDDKGSLGDRPVFAAKDPAERIAAPRRLPQCSDRGRDPGDVPVKNALFSSYLSSEFHARHEPCGGAVGCADASRAKGAFQTCWPPLMWISAPLT